MKAHLPWLFPWPMALVLQRWNYSISAHSAAIKCLLGKETVRRGTGTHLWGVQSHSSPAVSLAPELSLQVGLMISSTLLAASWCAGAEGFMQGSCIWLPPHTLFLGCGWDFGVMLGTPGHPVARAELSKPLIHTWFSCKHRKDTKVWPQAMCGDTAVTRFHPVSVLMIWLLSSQVVCYVAGVSDSISSLVGQDSMWLLILLNFLPISVLHFQMDMSVLNREEFKVSCAPSFPLYVQQHSFTPLRRSICSLPGACHKDRWVVPFHTTTCWWQLTSSSSCRGWWDGLLGQPSPGQRGAGSQCRCSTFRSPSFPCN